MIELISKITLLITAITLSGVLEVLICLLRIIGRTKTFQVFKYILKEFEEEEKNNNYKVSWKNVLGNVLQCYGLTKED